MRRSTQIIRSAILLAVMFSASAPGVRAQLMGHDATDPNPIKSQAVRVLQVEVLAARTNLGSGDPKGWYLASADSVGVLQRRAHHWAFWNGRRVTRFELAKDGTRTHAVEGDGLWVFSKHHGKQMEIRPPRTKGEK